MLKNNLALKLLALLIAVVVWIQISLLSEHQASVPIRVAFKDPARSAELARKLKKVPFRVQGRGLDILHLKLSKTVVEIDAEDLGQADERFAKLDYEVKNRPLNLDLEILGPDAGFELATVKGSGGSAAAKSGQDGSGQGVSDPRSAVKGTAPNPVLGEQPVTKVLEYIAITSTNGMLYTPSTATLKVHGKPSALSALPRGLLVLAAEKPDASGTYEVTVRLPEGVELLDHTPKRVRQRK